MALRKIQILVVDDHELVRTGLKALLESESDLEIVGEANTGELALKAVREKRPDIVLMDIKMPGIGGLETTRRLVHSFPDVKVIAVSSYNEDPYPSKLIQTGAAGFLAKNCSTAELLEAIRRVYAGQHYVSAEIAQNLAIRSAKAGVDDEGRTADPSIIKTLSERELQVLIMLGHGAKIQQIAEKLNITSKTVNTYRYRLYQKLGATTDVELAHIAIRHGLVDVEKGELG